MTGDPAGLRGPNAEAGLRGPSAAAGLRGPNAAAGLGGPNAAAGLGGPNTAAGLGGPNTAAGLGGPNAAAGLGGPDAAAGLGGPDAAAGGGGPSEDAGPPDFGDRELEVLTWEAFGGACRALAGAVVATGFVPDMVVSIARGGLVVGGAIAYALGVKNCFTMNVEYYTGVDERLAVPVVLPPVPDPLVLDDLAVLIADDVADTGHTLAMVQEFCDGHVRDARTCVLYRKPRSIIAPDFVWRETDRWIAFPWSAAGPVPGAAAADGG